MTWQEIADLITAKGTPCTRQAVQDFFKRRRKRRYAMGMEPEETTVPAAPMPARPEPVNLTDEGVTEPSPQLFSKWKQKHS